MCIPPPNRITANATVTSRCTVSVDSPSRLGTTSEATAAHTRKISGAGIRNQALILLDSSAPIATTATTSTTQPNGSTSPMAHSSADGTGLHSGRTS
jgi:hypothetical protein